MSSMDKGKCINFIQKVKIGYLATCDGDNQPYVRPVDMKTVYDGDIYFSTFSTTDKIRQIEKCSNVEILFLDGYLQLRIIGKAEHVKSSAMKERFLADNSGIAAMLTGNNKEELYIYKIVPKVIRFMGEDDNVYKYIDWK